MASDIDIEQIVRLVIEELMREGVAATGGEQPKIAPATVRIPHVECHLLFVFTGTDLGLSGVGARIQEETSVIQTCAYVTPRGRKIHSADAIKKEWGIECLLGEDDIDPPGPVLRDKRAVVVPALDRNTLSKMAVGICDEPVVCLLNECLATGRPTLFVRDGCDPRAAAGQRRGNPDLPGPNTVFEEYLDRLQVMGGQLCKAEDLPETLGRMLGSREQESEAWQGVITVDDLRDYQGKEIYLSPDARLTPLAQDFLASRHIGVIRLDDPDVEANRRPTSG